MYGRPREALNFASSLVGCAKYVQQCNDIVTLRRMLGGRHVVWKIGTWVKPNQSFYPQTEGHTMVSRLAFGTTAPSKTDATEIRSHVTSTRSVLIAPPGRLLIKYQMLQPLPPVLPLCYKENPQN